MRQKILVSWSGGKDSAWALHMLRQQGRYELAGLVTTVNSVFQRVAIHGFRTELLEMQAGRVGLPLTTVALPYPCSNEAYEAAMKCCFAAAKASGITGVAFGDLFLEDIRAYREVQLGRAGLEPVFPVWGLETCALAHEMLGSGLRARITCVDLARLESSFAGREFDDRLLADFPPGTDPCGERGEFHTFAYAGPMFSSAIAIETGGLVEREGVAYADLTAC